MLDTAPGVVQRHIRDVHVFLECLVPAASKEKNVELKVNGVDVAKDWTTIESLEQSCELVERVVQIYR